MADAESPSGGFSLTKRYGPLPAWAWGLLGGAGVYAVYRFRQARSAASTAATTAATGADATQPVDYAPQISVLQAEIQQLQQGENGEGVSKPPPVVPGEPPPVDIDNPGGTNGPPGGGSKKMPNVVGERANFAIGELKSGYGVRATTVPPRNPDREYVVTGQTPRAGATVNPGTAAVLRVKVDSTHRPPRRPKRTSGNPPSSHAGGTGGGPPAPRRRRVTA